MDRGLRSCHFLFRTAYKLGQTDLVENRGKVVGAEISARNGTSKSSQVRPLLVVIIRRGTGQNRHFDRTGILDGATEYNLRGKPCTQFARNGKVEPSQSFQERRLATRLVANHYELRKTSGL